MIDYNIYIQEIIKFLSTLTIKFDPIMYALNNKYRYLLPVKDEEYVSNNPGEQIDITTYPYYINLMGDYHQFNTKVYIKDGTFLISRSNLDKNLEIRNHYQTNYKSLEYLFNKYPQSIEIIKCSVFPIMFDNYEDLHNQPNLSILGYCKDFLNVNEEDDLIYTIRRFIDYIIDRWYVEEFFIYEDMFPYVWWSTFWFLVFIVLSTKRILNIKTDYVHDFHIMEFLLSKGFKKCNNFFNNYIKKFLYKNYEYLNKHRGKNSILELLDDYILKPLGFGLKKYQINKHTFLRQQYADWEPEIVLTDKNEVIDSDFKFTVEEFLYKLYNQGIITRYDKFNNRYLYEYIKYNRWNKLLTKYLSLSQESLNTFYDRFAYPMIFDLTIDLISKNQIGIEYDLTERILQLNYEQSVKTTSILELIYIYTYCMLKHELYSEDIMAYAIPTEYNGMYLVPSSEYEDNKYFFIKDTKSQIDTYVPVQELLDRIYYVEKLLPISSEDGLYEYMSILFNVVVEIVMLLRTNGSLNLNYAFLMFLDQVFKKKIISIPKFKDDIETFGDYFNKYRQDLLKIFEDFTREDYLTLAVNILFSIINIDDKFSPYTSISKLMINTECLYDILRKFNSYNVTYTTERFKEKIIFNYPLFRCGSIKQNNTAYMTNIIEQDMIIKHYSKVQHNDLITLELDTDVSYKVQCNDKIELGLITSISDEITNTGKLFIDTGTYIKIN